MTHEEVESAFAVHGTVSKVELKDSFAYVYMSSGGTRAHDAMDGARIGSSKRKIRVEWARNLAHGRNEPTTPNSTLYVADYDAHTTPDDLRTLFETYGKTVRISPCKKFTFIEFEKLEDAIRAHDDMQDKTVGARTLTVQYALPEPHRKSAAAPAESAPEPAAGTTAESSAGSAAAPTDSVTAS